MAGLGWGWWSGGGVITGMGSISGVTWSVRTRVAHTLSFALFCSTVFKGLPLELWKSAQGKEMKNEHELSAQPGGGGALNGNPLILQL